MIKTPIIGTYTKLADAISASKLKSVFESAKSRIAELDNDKAAETFFVTDAGDVYFTYMAHDGLLLMNKLDPICTAITDNGFIPCIVATDHQKGGRFLCYSSLPSALIPNRSLMVKWASTVGRTESPCYAMPA